MNYWKNKKKIQNWSSIYPKNNIKKKNKNYKNK